MWLRRIIRPKLLGSIVFTHAGFCLMSMGPLSFLVSLLAGQPAVGWLIFLDKALLALLLLGGIGISLQKLWGKWLVISSLSIGLIVIVITALRHIEEIVSSITQHAYLAMTGLSIVVPALLILLSSFLVKISQSEAATSNAVDGAKKILLSMLYTVHLFSALLRAMIYGIYLLEYSGTKEMLAMLVVIPHVMSLPVIAIFSLFGIGLSVMYKDMSLATLSALAIFCLMLFEGMYMGFKVPEYVLHFAERLYIILSFAFSIRWFYFELPRLRQQRSLHNPKDINPLT